VPREIDPPQGALDTAITAMMDLDARLDRLAGHWFNHRTRRVPSDVSFLETGVIFNAPGSLPYIEEA
jgi:hypothetical protein